MRISYDPEANAVYIELRDADSERTEDLEDGVAVDYDADGHVTGLEILDARERLGPRGLRLVVEGLGSVHVLGVGVEPDAAALPVAGGGNGGG